MTESNEVVTKLTPDLAKAPETIKDAIAQMKAEMDALANMPSTASPEFEAALCGDDFQRYLKAMPAPKLDDIAWVESRIDDLLKDGGGSFRTLIYDAFGLGTFAYLPLYLAGGMNITNEFCEGEEAAEALKMATDFRIGPSDNGEYIVVRELADKDHPLGWLVARDKNAGTNEQEYWDRDAKRWGPINNVTAIPGQMEAIYIARGLCVATEEATLGTAH